MGKKSQGVQFILTFFFGPLGLFYSSVASALGLILAAIAIGAFTAGIGGLIVWPVSILVGFAAVSAYNGKVDTEERRHQETLAALRTNAQVVSDATPAGAIAKPNPEPPTEEETGEMAGLTAEQLLNIVRYKRFPEEKRRAALDRLQAKYPGSRELHEARRSLPSSDGQPQQ